MVHTKNLAGGLLFAFLLYFTSFFGSIVFLIPFLPLILLKPQWARWIMDFFLGLWHTYAVALYEVMMGVKIVIHGKPAKISDSTLIIMNHRTRLDWLFLYSYQVRCGTLRRFKISLKKSLKFIAGPGWAMQCAAFMFLQRKWEVDRPLMSGALNYFSRLGYHPQILLFPEGTDLTQNTLEKSNAFAEANGFQKYHYLLHPRTKGFVFLTQEMHKGKILDSILDVTIAYPKSLTQRESTVLYGKFPEEIHFYVKSTPISEIPLSDEGLEKWCKKKWAEKEERLNTFYEKKEFSTSETEGGCHETVKSSETFTRYCLYGVILFWTLFIFFVLYMLLTMSVFRWYTILSIICFVLIDRVHDGVDNVLFSYQF